VVDNLRCRTIRSSTEADDTVGAGGIDELRIDTVRRIEAVQTMAVLADLEIPVGSGRRAREILAFPPAEFAGPGRIEIIVIAAQAALAAGADEEIVAGLCPQDIVAEHDVDAGSVESHCIADWLVDCIAYYLVVPADEQDTLLCITIDDVIAHHYAPHG